MSYFPLDRDILSSSVWAQGTPEQLKVWFYLLLEADPRTGVVEDADPGIAIRCKLPLEVTVEALEWLAAPDPFSRTKDNDGRRLERRPEGGIRILNYERHRDRDWSTPRVKKWRQRRAEAAEAAQQDETVKRVSTVTGTTNTNTNNEQTNNNPPTPRKRGESKASRAKGTRGHDTTPEVMEAVAKFNTVFQRATGRRASLAPDRARDFAQRVADGFPVEFLVGLPVGWVSTLAPDADRIRSTRPDFLLRNGSKAYRRGEETRPQFDWTGTIWGALDRVRLTSDQVETLRDVGVLDWWKSKGARPAAEAETW